MRRILIAFAALSVLSVAAVLGAGEMLSRPASRAVGEAPTDLGATSVRIPTSPTTSVAGWFARGTGRGAVLLLHGVRADRTQMLGRAEFLRAEGYSVLLIDLPAHGESSGERITFGAHEGAGVLAALGYLRANLPGERVGVIGVSLGAASLVLSRPTPSPSAVIVESMYPTITEAVADRLVTRLGPVGNAIAPLLLWQLPLRTDVTAAQLRPIVAIAEWQAPLLVASGTEDQHTTWQETERIFAAAQQPKELWAVPGAAHVDLYAYAPAAYKGRVLKFFARHLRHQGSPEEPTFSRQ
jgi:fermentation-respiration switch protein FrsA (DUF1100 family)